MIGYVYRQVLSNGKAESAYSGALRRAEVRTPAYRLDFPSTTVCFSLTPLVRPEIPSRTIARRRAIPLQEISRHVHIFFHYGSGRGCYSYEVDSSVLCGCGSRKAGGANEQWSLKGRFRAPFIEAIQYCNIGRPATYEGLIRLLATSHSELVVERQKVGDGNQGTAYGLVRTVADDRISAL